MAYASVEDVQARMTRTMDDTEQAVCATLLCDAAVIIDSHNAFANSANKKVVSCRMVVRALGDGDANGFPIGATQGSMSGLGYSQSWTNSSGTNAELYLGRVEKKLLGAADQVGSYSPVEELARGTRL